MKSILLVLGTRRYRDALLGAVAAVRAGEHASLHVVVLSGTRAAGAGRVDATAVPLPGAGEPRPASVDVVSRQQPGEILARARAVHADLIILAPELPPDCGPLWLDPLVVRVAAEAEQAVLVFRDSGRWPPRRALLPLVEADAATTTLTRAAGWLDTLFSSGEEKTGSVPTLDVLRVAADMERWYGMDASLRAEAGELREGIRARMLDCMRFGTDPSRRILRWINQEAPDLLVLGRQPPAEGGRPETDHAWLRVLSGARCSVLLLPPPSVLAGPPRRDDDALLWRRLSGLWPRGGTRDLLQSA